MPEPHTYTTRDETQVDMEGEACTEQLPGSANGTVVKHDILKLTDEGPQNNTPNMLCRPVTFCYG